MAKKKELDTNKISSTHRVCNYCGLRMWQTYQKKHLDRCKKKKALEIHERMKSLDNSEKAKYEEEYKQLSQKHQMIQIRYEQLLKVMRKLILKGESIVGIGIGADPIEAISQLNLSATTKTLYEGEWKAYDKWCKDKDINPFQIASANRYISSISFQHSTLVTKRSCLQSILQTVLERRVVLRKLRKRLHLIVPKYALSENEIRDYLKEQEKINKEDHLIQLLLVSYGLRINSIAGLMVKHFNNNSENITFPDTKTGDRFEPITPELKRRLAAIILLKGLKDPNSFLFHGGKSTEVSKRAAVIDARINSRIKNSKVLKKSPQYKYSSHMFRKTKAFTAFNKVIEEAKEKARIAIGHARGSSAIDCYLTRAKPSD